MRSEWKVLVALHPAFVIKTQPCSTRVFQAVDYESETIFNAIRNTVLLGLNMFILQCLISIEHIYSNVSKPLLFYNIQT